MKSFTAFTKDEFLALESIYYHDQHLFKFICEGKFEPTVDELAKIEMDEKLISESEDKSYLQNDEEVELIKKYQADPDSQEGRDAMDKLIENKMGLIYSKVNKHLITHPNQATHKDDLVQEGALALMKAIESFDVNSKNIFNAYAIKCITGAILNAYNPVRQKSVVDGKVDDVGNVTTTTSIDAPVSGSKGEWADKDMTVGDSIPDENALTPGADEDLNAEKRAMLNDWVKQLPEREAKALRMYFPANKEDQKTFEEIGKELKMSKMGAKKLIDRIISNLKKKAADFSEE